MPKPRIAVFSGPRATIANTPPLVTSNKGRAAGERQLEGRFDHLVPQRLHEPVRVRIEKFSAHPAGIRRLRSLPRRREALLRGGAATGGWCVPRSPTWRDAPTAQPTGHAVRGLRPDVTRPSTSAGGRSFFPGRIAPVREHRPWHEPDAATTARRASWTGSRTTTSCACCLRRATRSRARQAGRDFFPYSPRPHRQVPVQRGDGPRGEHRAADDRLGEATTASSGWRAARTSRRRSTG